MEIWRADWRFDAWCVWMTGAMLDHSQWNIVKNCWPWRAAVSLIICSYKKKKERRRRRRREERKRLLEKKATIEMLLFRCVRGQARIGPARRHPVNTPDAVDVSSRDGFDNMSSLRKAIKCVESNDSTSVCHSRKK